MASPPFMYAELVTPGILHPSVPVRSSRPYTVHEFIAEMRRAGSVRHAEVLQLAKKGHNSA